MILKQIEEITKLARDAELRHSKREEELNLSKNQITNIIANEGIVQKKRIIFN